MLEHVAFTCYPAYTFLAIIRKLFRSGWIWEPSTRRAKGTTFWGCGNKSWIGYSSLIGKHRHQVFIETNICSWSNPGSGPDHYASGWCWRSCAVNFLIAARTIAKIADLVILATPTFALTSWHARKALLQWADQIFVPTFRPQFIILDVTTFNVCNFAVYTESHLIQLFRSFWFVVSPGRFLILVDPVRPGRARRRCLRRSGRSWFWRRHDCEILADINGGRRPGVIASWVITDVFIVQALTYFASAFWFFNSSWRDDFAERRATSAITSWYTGTSVTPHIATGTTTTARCLLDIFVVFDATWSAALWCFAVATFSQLITVS